MKLTPVSLSFVVVVAGAMTTTMRTPPQPVMPRWRQMPRSLTRVATRTVCPRLAFRLRKKRIKLEIGLRIDCVLTERETCVNGWQKGFFTQ